jgi:hypothetical protein
MQSLASDAAAVRQLSSLASSEDFSELNQVNWNLTALEQKVVALRSIVTEEKKAIAKMETSVHQECEAQKHRMETIQQVYQQQQQQQQQSLLKQKSRRDSLDPRIIPLPFNQENEDTLSTKEDKNSIHQFTLELVSHQEFQGINRNTVGRIQLLDLNEALEEIQTVVQTKFDALTPLQPLSSNSASENRKLMYLLNKKNQTLEEVEAHKDHYWVSEQELRETCLFFKQGESSARAILQILCVVKRLKQVPGHNHKVTYICL